MPRCAAAAGVATLAAVAIACGSGSSASTPSLRDDGTSHLLVAIGPSFACAARIGGTVQCWGVGFALDAITSACDCTHAPTPAPTVAAVARLVAGANHACALAADGSVTCWGSNAKSQIDPSSP